MIEIGGLSEYAMVGEDTVAGDSLIMFPVKDGRIPWASVKSRDTAPDLYRIIWIDQMGKRRQGLVRVRQRVKEV